MALINHENQYIFLHIYKTGGNSLRKLLSGEEVLGVHCSAIDLKEYLYNTGKQRTWDNYYKFAVVRNPFDWMVSLFCYVRDVKIHEDHHIVKGMNINEFLMFVRDVAMKRDRPHGSNKYLTLKGFLFDGDTPLVDDVLTLEDLQTQLPSLKDRLGLSSTELPVINVNPKREGKYQNFFDEEGRKLMEEIFGEDMKIFGYEF